MLGKFKVAGLLVLMLIASVFAATAAPAFAVQTHVLTVNVYDGTTDVAISADSVDVYTGTTSDLAAHRDGGSVVYIALAEGLYKVDVAKEGYNSDSQYVSVEADMAISAYLYELPSQGGDDQGQGDDQGGDGQAVEGIKIDLDIKPNDEVKPGEEVEFEVEVKNKLGYDIEDVVVEITVDDIDDDDDWEDEVEYDELDDDEKETETFAFTIPYDADDKKYDIKVKVDWDGAKNPAVLRDTIEVEKEKHDVAIINAYLGSETVAPGKTAELAVDLANIGENDEDVRVKIEAQDLNVEVWSAQFELEDGETATQYIPFTVPKNVEAGKYFVYVTTYFNNGVDSSMDFVTLNVDGKTATATGAVSLTPVITTVAGEDGIGFTDDAYVIGGLIVGILVLLAVIAAVAKHVIPKKATLIESTRRKRR